MEEMTVEEYKARFNIPGIHRKYPLESEEQQALFSWARLSERTYPELALLVHIPNGGYRNMSEAVRFKREGVKRGFPDILLPVARGGYHSLAIELKRIRGSSTSPEQKQWINALSEQGWKTAICKGWVEARDLIIKYLEL